MTRPALNDATRHAREAEMQLSHFRLEYERAYAALLLGEAEETEVEACERAVETAERDVRRYSAARRELESRLGVIRDPTGHIL